MAKRLRTSKSGDESGLATATISTLADTTPATVTTSTSAKDEPAEKLTRTTLRSRIAASGSPAKGKGATAAATSKGSATTETKHVMLPAFLSKTFEIFSMPEFAGICGWNANGDTIIVSQLESFVAMVLPRFFKHRNFPSFVRQLNLYGFHKTVLDSKRLEFQHPYFKRGRPDLLHHIKRKVSSGPSASNQQQQQQQQLVNTAIQNSRLEAHREISDNLLREMKELRHRSEAMEKRLRELEIDNAIVRSDNLKLWKHLETAKDKQLIMQEKMKKIMWILYQIYRGKQGMPKLSGNESSTALSEDYINSSMLGPKEFREVLRFLAMDEPPMLPDSSHSEVALASQPSRKRKGVFVEVPSDTRELYAIEPASVVEVGSPMHESISTAMMVPTSSIPTSTVESSNNVLSIFSPPLALSNISSVPNTEPATVGEDANVGPTNSTDAVVDGSNEEQAKSNQLDFIDDELPLLSDSVNYPFAHGEEQQVMKKLEDFETSLLDEYDVTCLDTLLQQLKSSNMEKSPGLPVIDPEEIFVGGPEDVAARDA